ncbi:MAG: protein kinase [bacterium]
MGLIKHIGEIEIFAEISQGATTLVYKGYQPSLDRMVLLKLLRPEFNQDEQLSQRFEEEAKLVAKVQHPNVVAIYDYGRQDQFTYISAEFIEGFNLHDLIQRDRIPCDIAWFILLETAKGLKAAHDKNIIHKDIKPSNILISHEGQVKLTDFGMASLRMPTQDEELVEVRGTLAYISPEEFLGEEVKKGSDIFSLGATFYEMLTGSQAFVGKTPGDYVNAILHEEPAQFLRKSVAIPAELSQICQKMLVKDPAHRYQDCQELIQDLDALQIQHNFTQSSDNLKAYLEKPKAYVSKIFSSEALEAPVAKQIKLRNYVFVVLSVALLLAVGYYGLFFNKTKGDGGNEVSLKPAESIDQELVATAQESINLDQLVKPKDSFDEAPIISIDENRLDVTTQEEPIRSQVELKSQPDSVVLDKSDEESLTGNLGYLNVFCTPWAVIYIDGDSIGTTPFKDSIALTTGRHEIVFKNPEFPEYKKWIELRSDEIVNIELSLWTLVGKLKLTVSPWAEVYIDGEYKDTVPPQDRPCILSPGRHSLILRHPVLGEWQTPIEISAGQSLELKFNLKNLISQ